MAKVYFDVITYEIFLQIKTTIEKIPTISLNAITVRGESNTLKSQAISVVLLDKNHLMASKRNIFEVLSKK